MTRQAIHHALENRLTQSLREERINQEVAGRTADGAEGVAAFTQKRRADFLGR
jgi:enoyl-CoA hydratase/carnithine racemase